MGYRGIGWRTVGTHTRPPVRPSGTVAGEIPGNESPMLLEEGSGRPARQVQPRVRVLGNAYSPYRRLHRGSHDPQIEGLATGLRVVPLSSRLLADEPEEEGIHRRARSVLHRRRLVRDGSLDEHRKQSVAATINRLGLNDLGWCETRHRHVEHYREHSAPMADVSFGSVVVEAASRRCLERA